MTRYKIFGLTLLLVSSLFLLVYTRPGTRVEVDPTGPTEFMFLADTRTILIEADGQFSYDIQIHSSEDNYSSVYLEFLDQQGDIEIDLTKSGIYFISISSSSIGSLTVRSIGIPPQYLVFMGMLTVIVAFSFRDNITRLINQY